MRSKFHLVVLATAALATLTLAPATAATATPSASTTGGRTYEVDCSAKADGDGLTTPWNSLDAITNHGPFSPGDRVLIRRGTTCKGRTVPTGSGSSAAPIVLGAYGSGKVPTLAGGGTPSGTAVILLKDVRYWTVQDLHITNRGASARTTSAYRAGVSLQNSGSGRLSGLVVQRLRIDNVVSNMNESGSDSREWGAIVATTYGAGTSDGFNGLVIRNNVIDHVGRTGIMVSNHEYPGSSDRGTRVTGNRISWARGDSIVLRGAVGARIDHNVSAHGADEWPCSDCGAINPKTANAGIWVSFSKNIRIDHNEVYGEHVLGGDGEAFDADDRSFNVVFEDNYAHDNAGGGILFCGSTNAIARFNILENNSKSAFAFIGNLPAKNTQIYNNTVYGSKHTNASAVRYFNGRHGSGIKFINNVVYNYGKGYWGWPTSVSSRSNTYVGVHRKLEPHGAGYSWANPGLKNPGSGKDGRNSLGGYKPKHPLTFVKGVAIPSSVKTDFFGKRINSKHPPRGAAG